MSITAKAKCSGKSLTNMGTDYEAVNLTFGADYANGANKAWASATPTLNLTMTVKPEVAKHFEIGSSFTLTFDKD